MGAPSSLLTGLISHSGFVLGYTHERTTQQGHCRPTRFLDTTAAAPSHRQLRFNTNPLDAATRCPFANGFGAKPPNRPRVAQPVRIPRRVHFHLSMSQVSTTAAGCSASKSLDPSLTSILHHTSPSAQHALLDLQHTVDHRIRARHLHNTSQETPLLFDTIRAPRLEKHNHTCRNVLDMC